MALVVKVMKNELKGLSVDELKQRQSMKNFENEFAGVEVLIDNSMKILSDKGWKKGTPIDKKVEFKSNLKAMVRQAVREFKDTVYTSLVRYNSAPDIMRPIKKSWESSIETVMFSMQSLQRTINQEVVLIDTGSGIKKTIPELLKDSLTPE